MSNDYLHGLRDFELAAAIRDIPLHAPDGRATHVLELGAGTGQQAARLQAAGYRVTAIDLPSSAYAQDRVFPVQDYDGVRIPLRDRATDVVFSSNVLEHVGHLEELLAETRRVLRADGIAVHVLPTANWRLWTTLTHYPWFLKRLVQRLLSTGRARAGGEGASQGATNSLLETLLPTRHGERGNVFTELGYFSERWWRRAFERAGFEVVSTRQTGLFYTGSVLVGAPLGIAGRRRLAGLLGSACRIYVLKPGVAASTNSAGSTEVK